MLNWRQNSQRAPDAKPVSTSGAGWQLMNVQHWLRIEVVAAQRCILYANISSSYSNPLAFAPFIVISCLMLCIERSTELIGVSTACTTSTASMTVERLFAYIRHISSSNDNQGSVDCIYVRHTPVTRGLLSRQHVCCCGHQEQNQLLHSHHENLQGKKIISSSAGASGRLQNSARLRACL